MQIARIRVPPERWSGFSHLVAAQERYRKLPARFLDDWHGSIVTQVAAICPNRYRFDTMSDHNSTDLPDAPRGVDAHGRCVKSGKRAYPSKVRALAANARKPLMARAYRCAACGQWHLTRKVQ